MTLDTRMDLAPIVERLRAAHFGELAGAEAFVKVPLREPLVNTLLETAVLPSVPALRELRAVFHDGNRLDVIVAFSRARWLPAVTVPLEVDPHVSMDPSPTLRLHLRDDGLIGRLGSLAGAWKDRLPPGVRLVNRVVEIDLKTLLAERDPWGLLDLLRQSRVTTGRGVLWIETALGVPSSPPTPPGE